MKPKYLLLLASFLVASAGARAATVDQDGVLIDGNGNVFTMYQADAIKACVKLGMHLPTIRELVKLSQSEGITLKEPYEVSEREIWDGAMKRISAVNPNGKTDLFYYSNDNYSRSGYLGSNIFWSSSVVSDGSCGAYYINGFNGKLGCDNREYSYSGAARCVVGQ